MRKYSGLSKLGFLAGVVCVAMPSANAQLTTFASSGAIGEGPSFYGGAGAATPAKYISFSSATNLLTIASSTNVEFKFQDLSNKTVYDPFGRTSIRALMSLTATAAPNSATYDAGTNSITQLFTNITIKYTAIQPYTNSFGTFTDLLTVNFASGQLSGTLGTNTAGGSPTFESSSPATSSGALVGYQSDFLNFSGVTSEQFSISMSGAVNTGSGASGNALQLSGNQLQSFNADGSFNFSANPPPTSMTPTPAPPGVVSGLIGIAMGGAQFGMVRFRKRRRAPKTEAAA